VGVTTVRRNKLAVAECYLQRQADWLRLLIGMAKERRASSVSVSLKFDETKESLRMHTAKGALANSEHDDVEVMVATLRLVVSMPGVGAVLCWDAVFPPVPLLSTSATHILAALTSHPAAQEVLALVDELMMPDHAEVATFTHEFDGAAGNDRLQAHFAFDKLYAKPHVHYEKSLCQNHSDLTPPRI
ncbi:unnamed protein product, partial [Prorocentrum cordatum]